MTNFASLVVTGCTAAERLGLKGRLVKLDRLYSNMDRLV